MPVTVALSAAKVTAPLVCRTICSRALWSKVIVTAPPKSSLRLPMPELASRRSALCSNVTLVVPPGSFAASTMSLVLLPLLSAAFFAVFRAWMTR